MSIGSRLFPLLFHAPWVVRGALSRSALPAFNLSFNENAPVHAPSARFWERSTSLPTPRGDFEVADIVSSRRVTRPQERSPQVLRFRRLAQRGGLLPNPIHRLKALNRPEGALIKRKKSAFSRRTSRRQGCALEACSRPSDVHASWQAPPYDAWRRRVSDFARCRRA
jgi:hypothetical protein